ncbi:PspC domain-containing protein [Pedobacter insulae]|uniref:Phage shock protein PspC (Stress-responsive transcriptional regulator) n=1 Tax=Pedobacter insulae TaxID=414048 RepID=A0A1I2Y9D8_9SPHI|nr:PspC domain-containing protein [Pedobacter insulae]SFH20991.1 Phage shock protein PspC (stress-responsive transcriptional regulator) [Pedobacter insulae]
MEKKLYRNEHDKVFSGVSSGLADYLGYDVLLIRILFVLSAAFTAGVMLLVYIVFWIVLPAKNDPSARFSQFNNYYQKQGQSFNDPMFNSPNAFSNPANSDAQTKWNTQNAGPNFTMPNNADFNTVPKGNDTGRTVAGLIILLLGVYFLLKQFIFIPIWFSIYKLWPLVIVAVGISLIFKNKRKTEWEQFKRETEEAKKPSAETQNEPVVVKDENNDTTAPIV